ncbi:DUF3500 domain-containing protein [Streptomyces thinghirensis]|nr:DUF3500 domain-containing protein [Streptomyces thinghirensis]
MHAHRPRTPETERTRRWFMNRVAAARRCRRRGDHDGLFHRFLGDDGYRVQRSAQRDALRRPGRHGSGRHRGWKYADFVGVTTDGKVVDDLFSIHSTDVSTDKVVQAAQAFLDGLTAKERKASVFEVDDDE